MTLLPYHNHNSKTKHSLSPFPKEKRKKKRNSSSLCPRPTLNYERGKDRSNLQIMRWFSSVWVSILLDVSTLIKKTLAVHFRWLLGLSFFIFPFIFFVRLSWVFLFLFPFYLLGQTQLGLWKTCVCGRCSSIIDLLKSRRHQTVRYGSRIMKVKSWLL